MREWLATANATYAHCDMVNGLARYAEFGP